MALILYGLDVAKAIDERTILKVNELKEKNLTPTLAVVRVGEREDDLSYERGIFKKSEKTGVAVKHICLPSDVSYDEFYKTLDELNDDNSVNGILLFRPLPKYLDNNKARNYIKASKDVDGSSDLSLAGVFTDTDLGFAPCTASAVIECLDYYNIDVASKNVVVIGRSLVIGKPVSMLLLRRNATVTICHSKTNDIPSLTKNADIIVVATGRMESIGKEYVSDKSIVIDVGINWSNEKNKLCGDVKFDDVEKFVQAITPVPKGIGSITTSVLLNNVVLSAYKNY